MNLKKIRPQNTDNDRYEFHVWAPGADEVALLDLKNEREFPMKISDRGYWNVEIEGCEPGFRYKYKIGDDGTFPDPASLSQPDGVHGPSEVIQLKSFPWDDEQWNGIPLKEMIIYELHTGTFSPEHNFQGIIKKLDYLKALGINAIEIMPVARFSGERNWGYDGAYPFAVQTSYGGASGLMELVNACHRNGIAVILDVVYNHLGPEGNYLSNFGPYFTDQHSTPWGSPINFDGPYSDEVRNYFIQNALMWCRDFHIDALRLDAIHAIYDFGAKHFLKELAEHVEQLGNETNQKYYLIAESNLNDTKFIDNPEKGGFGLDAQWADDFHHAFHALVTGENNGYYMDYGNKSHLVKALKDAFVYDGEYAEFRKKTYGNKTTGLPAERFVVFQQNHDQTGNRKHGERLIEITDFETAKVAAGLMFISPYVPMLFMGEEYGERNPFLYFVSHEDQKLNRLVKKGRQQEFKDFQSDETRAPDPSAEDTFRQSMLSWDIEHSEEKQAMFEFYKRCIALRKNHPVLKVPDNQNMRVAEIGEVITLERWKDKTSIVTVINPGSYRTSVKMPGELNDKLEKILDSTDTKWKGPNGACPQAITANDQISVPGRSIIVYSNTRGFK